MLYPLLCILSEDRILWLQERKREVWPLVKQPTEKLMGVLPRKGVVDSGTRNRRMLRNISWPVESVLTTVPATLLSS